MELRCFRDALSRLGLLVAPIALLHCGPTTQQPESPAAPAEQRRPGDVPWADGDEVHAGKTREVLPEPKSYDQPIDPGDDNAIQQPTSSGGRCFGQVTDELRAELSERGGRTKRCYDQLLRDEPEAEGRLQMSLRLTEDGRVASAIAVRDTVGHPKLIDCVQQELSAPVRHPPQGGCATVMLPLNFKQPEEPEDEDSEESDRSSSATEEPSAAQAN